MATNEKNERIHIELNQAFMIRSAMDDLTTIRVTAAADGVCSFSMTYPDDSTLEIEEAAPNVEN